MLKSETVSPKKTTRKTTTSGAARKKTGATTRSRNAAPAPTIIRKTIRQAALREPTDEEIARRAYELYLARGRQDGRAADDWLRAEQELRGERRRALALREGKGVPRGNA